MTAKARSENSVKSIFLNAIRFTDPDARRAYLAEACGQEEEVRRTVEKLLAARERATANLLDDVVQRLQLTQTKSLTGDELVEIEAHPLIGPYKLLELIGEGGMGVVYMAQQMEPVKRKVAVKLVKPGMDSREVIARFEAERQALAMMDHPNIARIFDAGKTDQDRPYFVMELVRGVPIDRYCDETSKPIKGRLRLFLDVCRAVQHAHQKGIIHRDLKPSNVLITLHDGEPVVKVIDFGIAKALNQELTDQTLFTRFAQLVGTPVYMSPEQAEISGLDVDTRSDVYSLGILLYELLVGVPPFDPSTLKQVSLDEMRRILREDDPPRPSHRISTLDHALAATISERRAIDRDSLLLSVRRELDWVVMKALEKKRDRRYSSVSELAEDIERYLGNEPVQACPPSIPYALKKWIQRHRFIVSGAAVLAVALLVTSAVSLWRVREVREAWRASQAREQQANNLLEASQLQTAITAFQQADLVKLSESPALSGGPTTSPGTAAARTGSLTNLLRIAANPISRRVFPHDTAVFDLSVAPDGRGMVSIDSEGQLWFWDLTQDSKRRLIGSHGEPAHAVAISPDAARAVSGSTTGKIWFWDLQRGHLLKKVESLATGIETLIWSPDGQSVAAGARYHGVLVLNAQGETQFKVAKDARYESLLFSLDSKRLLVPTRGDIEVWDVESGERRGDFKVAPLEGVRAMCWAGPQRRWLIAGERFSELLVVLDGKTGKRLGTLPAGARYAQHLAASSDGQWLLAIYAGGPCQLIQLGATKIGEVTKLAEVRFVVDHVPATAVDEPRWTARWLPGADHFLTAGSDGQIRQWAVDAVLPFQVLEKPAKHSNARIRSVFPLPSSELVYYFYGPEADDDAAYRFDYSGRPTGPPAEKAASQIQSTSRPSAGRLVAQASDQRIFIVSLDSGRTIASIHSPHHMHYRVSLSEDGRTLAATSDQSELSVWRTNDGWHSVATFGPWRSPREQLPIIADNGRTVICIDRSFAGVTERDLETGSALYYDQKCAGGADLIVSHQGDMLAMSVDGGIRVVERQTKRVVLDRRTHSNAASLAFLPDDRVLVSGHEDRSIRAWHLPTGQPLGILYQPPPSLPGKPTQLLLADQGTRLLVIYDDPTQGRAVILGSLPSPTPAK